jgi:hypothetical protein
MVPYILCHIQITNHVLLNCQPYVSCTRFDIEQMVKVHGALVSMVKYYVIDVPHQQ